MGFKDSADHRLASMEQNSTHLSLVIDLGEDLILARVFAHEIRTSEYRLEAIYVNMFHCLHYLGLVCRSAYPWLLLCCGVLGACLSAS